MTGKIIAFYNNKNMLLSDISISVEDRSYLFGDGVYEVLRVYNKKPFLLEEHLLRLYSSLEKIDIKIDLNLKDEILNNIEVNNITEGMVYVQISRGTAPRTHSFHGLELNANVLIYSKHFFKHPAEEDIKRGVSAITHPDLRWYRCDIKSLNLLPNCMAQSKANAVGAKEAILYRDDGVVTEGSATNVFLVKDGVLKTPVKNNLILPGVTRQFIIDSLKIKGIEVREQKIYKKELFDADEIFITSSTKEAMSITKIDDYPVGNGDVGDMAILARKQILENI